MRRGKSRRRCDAEARDSRSAGPGGQGALARLGLDGVTDVRQGKRFEIDLEGGLDLERSEQVHKLAEELLANPVIEDYTVHIVDEGGVRE